MFAAGITVLPQCRLEYGPPQGAKLKWPLVLQNAEPRLRLVPLTPGQHATGPVGFQLHQRLQLGQN